MSMGFGFALPALRQNGFDPLSLFAGGTQGVWYDDSLTSSMYQDSAGTVAAVLESPVGLQLDLSRGGLLGAELLTNGDFSNGTTGWTIGTDGTAVVTLGIVRLTNVISRMTISQTLTTVVGQQYKIDFGLISNGNGGDPRVRFTSTNSYGGTLVAQVTSASSDGLLFFTATTSTTYIWLAVNNATAGLYVDFGGVSIKSDSSNPRLQATSANRPTLSARYNLFTKTEDFSNAAWTKVGLTVDATLYTAPNGTLTANKIYATIVSTNHYLYQAISLTSGVSYAATINGKVGEYRYLYLQTYNGSAFAASIVDLQTGLVTQTGSGHTITSVAVDNGFYYVKIVFTAAATGTGYFYAGPSDVSTAPTAYSWIGDPAKGIYIWGADFRPTNQTVTLPVYQRVDTSSVYDTVGFPQYLKYNGSNSSLSTASINFTATAQMSAFSGLRKISVITAVWVELSTSVSTNNGSFLIDPPDSADNTIGVYVRGTILLGLPITSSTVISPATITSASQLAIATSGTTISNNLNGSFINSSTGSTGTGNFGNYPLYFGSRAGTSFFFNGYEFQTIIVGKTLTATEISNTETYVNSKTKAY